jgi:hypothetical protein
MNVMMEFHHYILSDMGLTGSKDVKTSTEIAEIEAKIVLLDKQTDEFLSLYKKVTDIFIRNKHLLCEISSMDDPKLLPVLDEAKTLIINSLNSYDKDLIIGLISDKDETLLATLAKSVNKIDNKFNKHYYPKFISRIESIREDVSLEPKLLDPKDYRFVTDSINYMKGKYLDYTCTCMAYGLVEMTTYSYGYNYILSQSLNNFSDKFARIKATVDLFTSKK